MAITKRLAKGSALTHTELDGNFTDLDSRVTTLESASDSDSQTLTLAGDNLTISGGNTVDLSTINSTGILNVVEDTTPQLGGNLDLNSNEITGSGGSSISETLSVLTLQGGSNGIVMRSTGTGQLVLGSLGGNVVIGNSSNTVEFVNGVNVDLTNTDVNFTGATVTGLTVSQSIDSLTDVDTSTTPPGVGQVLKWDGSASKWLPANDSSGSGGITLSALSVTQASAGTAGLVYNNVTGVFTYTPPDLSSYLTSVPAQSFASLTGKPTTIAGYGITDPIVLSDSSVAAQPIRQYYANQAAFPSATDWHGAIAHSHADGAMYFAHGGVWNKLTNDADAFDGAYGSLTGAPTMYANADVDAHLNQSNPTSGYVLSWNGSDYAWVANSSGGSSYGDSDVATYLNGNLDTSIIPDTNATYDIGSAEYKVRHLFLSNNSLYIGDNTLRTSGSNLLLNNTMVNADTEYNNGAIIDVTGEGSDFFKRELTVNGVRIMGAGGVGGQTAVPDAWLEKVGRMFELFLDPTGSGITESAQRTVIKTLSGDTGTYHAAVGPTIQRVARGAGADYSTNFLTDSGIIFWNLTNLFNNTVQNDMVWYLNSTGSGYGDGDNDAQEVIEHVFHTLHMHGLDAVSLKMYPSISSDWNTGPLYNAMVEAYDGGFWDSSGYGGANFKTDSAAFEVAAKEYLYLLNFAMFDYSDLWDGASLSPEWADSVKTPSGVQSNLTLGYALYNSYIAPVISKPSLTTIRSIFQDGNTPAQDDPSQYGASGYVVDVFNGEFGSLAGKPTTLAGYGITDALTAGGALTGSSLEAVAVGAGVADGNDLAISGGDAVEVNSIGGNASITGGSGALQPGNVNIGTTQTTLVTIGSGSNNVDFLSGTAVDFSGATVTGLTVTETDPVVGAITGIVKADGAGNISAAVAGTDYSTFDGAFGSLSGTPTTLGGYGITDALSSGGNITLGGDLDVGGNSIVSASNGPINIAPNGSGAIELNGQVKFAEGMIEKFATTNGATGVTALDCATGNVHYLTAPAGDITANFTNLNLTAEYATNVTVIIDQGGTEREITAVQIGGVAQTIVWQGNSAPTGTANGVDSFSFTILNDGGTYVVLGQMVAFGGV